MQAPQPLPLPGQAQPAQTATASFQTLTNQVRPILLDPPVASGSYMCFWRVTRDVRACSMTDHQSCSALRLCMRQGEVAIVLRL